MRDQEFIARLKAGEIKAAIQAFTEAPHETLREIGAETVADAMRASLENVEKAAHLAPPGDLERMVRLIRADVNAMVKRARRAASPEDLVGVYMGVSLVKWVMDWRARGEGCG